MTQATPRRKAATKSSIPATGLTPGFGDVLVVYSGGMVYTNDVSVVPTVIIPVPGALLLGMIGIGTAGIFRRLRKSV